ncbi:MAG: diguanylate cyclase domain-containing protein [Phycisphaerales bacterium]
MSTTARAASEHATERRLRVILIGCPSLDRTLRRQPTIELIRAQTPLGAIGELSQPIDDDSPARTVIVVGDGTLPDSHAEAYRAAAHRLEPSVLVFAVISDPMSSPASAFDGVLEPTSEAGDLQRAIDRCDRPAQSEPVSTPPDQPAPPTEAVADLPNQKQDLQAAPQPDQQPVAPEQSRPRHTELPDDAKLVRAILAGRNLLESCMDQLRHRTGASHLQFISASDESAPEHGVPVAHRGHLLGHLVDADRSIPNPQLKVGALWLAHWLALGEQQRQLREAAFTDALTGAWNRRYFDRYLESCIRRASTRRQPVTILLFDVDDFKQFNDRHGHGVGDEILCSTVRLLQSCVRPSDRVCRIGGDEFAVVFYEPEGPRETGSSQPTSIFEIARRFQRRVQTEDFPILGKGTPSPLAVSGGLATYPWDGRTPAELLSAADRLLIESKTMGKNAIRYGSGVICCDDDSACS